MGSSSSVSHQARSTSQGNVGGNQIPSVRDRSNSCPPPPGGQITSYENPPPYQYPPQKAPYSREGTHIQMNENPEPVAYPPQQLPMEPSPQEEESMDPTARDLVLSRIMAADEFLGRMEENDEKVKQFVEVSRTQETEEFQPRITELMGLRGHLQDELLRIEAMLAQDDPELKNLRQFEAMFPKAVFKINDIHEKAKNMKTVTIGTEVTVIATSTATETDMDTDDMLSETGVQCLIPEGTSSSVGNGGEKRNYSDAGEQTDLGKKTSEIAIGDGDIEGDSDEVAKEKFHDQHKDEEAKVAQAYTDKLLEARKSMTQEDFDKVLSQHLLSMQALRKKQAAEKDKYKELLEQKKRERLLKHREQMDHIEPIGEDNNLERGKESRTSRDSGLESPSSKASSKEKRTGSDLDSDEDLENLSSDEESEFQFDETSGKLQDQIWQNRDTLTNDELKTIMAQFAAEQNERRHMNKISNNKHRAAADEKLKDWKMKNTQKANDDSESEEQEEITEDEIVMMHNEDEEFLQNLRKKYKDLSDEDFAELLKRHLSNVDAIRRKRKSERALLDDKLRKALEGRKRTSYQNNEDVDDEKAIKELEELEENFQEQIRRRKTHRDPDELEELLKEYREKQAEILRKRNLEKDQTNAILEEKLKNRMKKDKPEEVTEPGDSMEENILLAIQMSQKQGDLTKDKLAELLKSYTKQLDSERKAKSKKQREKEREKELADEAKKENAALLLKKHEEESQQIKDFRKKEKQERDEMLQRKLNARLKSSKKRVEEDTKDECDF